MEEEIDAEINALQKEYNWLLKEEVPSVLKELQVILGEACKRFPVQINTEDDSVAKAEKFILVSPNGVSQIKCVITLLADHICEADLTLRISKQQTTIINTKINPEMPWRVQQIQDAGNHLLHALAKVEGYEPNYRFGTGQQVIRLLDSVSESLHRGRSSLALPKKRTLEELVRNPTLKAFKPQLPNDVIVSFYVQAQKLILAVYQLYVNSSQKIDIQARHQVECSVPWLNDVLVLFTLALQHIQQLRDKLTVFQQYAAESKFLETSHLDLDQAAETGCKDVPPSGSHLGQVSGQCQSSTGVHAFPDGFTATSSRQERESHSDKSSDVKIMLDGPPKDFEKQPQLTCTTTHLIDL